MSLSVAVGLLLVGVGAAAPPEARAGRPFLAYPGDTIELNGSESSDPDGDPITSWAWAQVDGPAAALEDTGGPHPVFTANVPGTYSFELVVGAGGETSEPDVVDVIVVDPEAGTRHRDLGDGCSAAGGAGLAGLWVGILAVARRRR